MVRECTGINGASWRETCTLWEDGRRYAINIDTGTYPYPVQAMSAIFGVEPAPDGSRVTMQFTVAPTGDPASQQFVRMLKTSFRPTLDTILDAWQQKAEAANP